MFLKKPKYSHKYLKKRYGILSEVIVQRSDGFSLSEKNNEFIARGGRRRRIISVPASTDDLAMRQLAKQRIESSKAKKSLISLSLPGLFRAEAGDIMELKLTRTGLFGRYRVSEACTNYGDRCYTTLELIKE